MAASIEFVKYRPRLDFVVFRMVPANMSPGGVALPQVSEQAWNRVVVAIGPQVEDLEVGDKVLVIGTVGVDVVTLPREKDLLMTKQVNVALVVEDS